MMFGWIFLLILAVAVVWYFSRGHRTFSLDRRREESAGEMLRRRYANGEISREEYEQIKAIIEEEEEVEG